MRNFTKNATFLFALLILSQAVFAQVQDANVYQFPGYQNFKAGFSSSSDLVVLQGQVFKPIVEGATYEAYPGVELTLDGGPDFTVTVVTDASGMFAFDAVPVGAYTVFAQNADLGTFGNVQITLSRGISASTVSDNATDFDVASVKLSFDNDLYILGKKKVAAEFVEVAEVPAQGCCGMAGGCAAGAAGGAFGNMGMLGAALGAAGLAAGIAALADDDNDRGGHLDGRPVSVGAPRNK